MQAIVLNPSLYCQYFYVTVFNVLRTAQFVEPDNICRHTHEGWMCYFSLTMPVAAVANILGHLLRLY